MREGWADVSEADMGPGVSTVGTASARVAGRDGRLRPVPARRRVGSTMARSGSTAASRAAVPGAIPMNLDPGGQPDQHPE